ncbi:MAG TPA: efflux RND transporter periplasmic adaptor subunit [Xanthomonadaceae bacterium]|nr:efflux RND transporter periplasmic adaptor subunit [Xanthomonadaceae bacterium]
MQPPDRKDSSVVSQPASSQPPASQPAPSRRGLRIAGVAAAVVAVVVVAAGLLTRAAESSSLRDWTEAQALPAVAVVMPVSGANSSGLELPGRIEAFARAPIYARVSGYLKSWQYDIGAHVKAGAQLGEIETPDLDQQLLQARADLASAQANQALAQSTAKRWQAMLGSDSVSKQEVDEKTGDFTVKQAMVRAAQANVDRIVAMKGFARIVAPFDGTITARETDVGALINAGGGSAPELFVVSDTSKLRVYVNVPQSDVPKVTAGTSATVSVPEHPKKTYPAAFVSSAQSVNASSGTTLMQLAVDNSAGELMSGSYANVRIELAGPTESLSVPASSVIFDAKGLTVATVGADNRVMLKKVTIARDLGKLIEIGSGLSATDRVIDSPPDGIGNGAQVRVASNAANAGTAGGKAKE